MEYQIIRNDNATNQLSKFRTRNWVEKTDYRYGVYSSVKEIIFKSSLLKSRLCDYSNTYILKKRTITVANTVAADIDVNNTNTKVIFRNCITEINNTQVDNA